MTPKVVHLTYHYVRRPEEEQPQGLTCGVERFRRQLDWLNSNNWLGSTCRDFTERYIDGDLPERAVTLSFDDGLRDGIQTIAPLLKEFGFSGTFFVITCARRGEVPAVIKFQRLLAEVGPERMEKELLPRMIGGTPYVRLLDPTVFDLRDLYSSEAAQVRRSKAIFNRFLPVPMQNEIGSRMFVEVFGAGAEARLAGELFMSAKEWRDMEASGMEIAPHSVTHPYMGLLSLDEVRKELRDSGLEVYGATERPETFCWPFGGRFAREVFDAAREAGYWSAWNYFGGLTEMPQPPYDDLMDIPRVDQQHFEKVFGIKSLD